MASNTTSQEDDALHDQEQAACQAPKGRFLRLTVLSMAIIVGAIAAQFRILTGNNKSAYILEASSSPFYALSSIESNGEERNAKADLLLRSALEDATSTTEPANTATTTADSSQGKPLNILLLYTDDWRHDTLGVANPIIQTPVLDQLAKEGVRFTHNCVTTSLCWVSRATLFSGQYMARHGTTRPKDYFAPENETIWSLLQDEGGYYTGHVGKLGIWKPDFVKQYIIKMYPTEEHWHRQKRDGRAWHITELNEFQSLEFLDQRPRDKPFFLHVGFYATHAVDYQAEQYLPQPESKLKYYVNDTIPYPFTGSRESRQKLPPFFTESNEGRKRFGKRYNEDIIMSNGENQFQYMMKNTYRMVTEVDTTCGRIMDKLKEQGDLDNTLIIFTADNGNLHAEHGLADKWYPHEESIRVPLIVKDPRMKPEMIGTTNDEFTLNIDLAPTILSAAGLQALPSMMGRDMSVLYCSDGTPPNQPEAAASRSAGKASKAHMTPSQFPWRKEFFYEHPTLQDKHYIPSSEALVRKDWKYFYWPDFDTEQLFDMSIDPIEDNDLIKSNATIHKLVLKEMRARFLELKLKVHSDDIITL